MKFISLFVVFASICAALVADDKKLEKVSLQLSGKHQFEFAGFYVAKEKGYYRDLGLDVSFIEADSKIIVADEVLRKKAMYGIAGLSVVADYLDDKPLLLVANFFKHSPLALITQKEITSLSQLRGSTIEGLSVSLDDTNLYRMLSKFGINNLDIEVIAQTKSLKNFLNRKIDGMKILTIDELFLLNNLGVKYNIYNPLSYGSLYFTSNLFTSDFEYQKHPQRVKNFKAASIKGWKYALANKSEVVTLIRKKYNSQKKSRRALLFEADEVEKLMLPEKYEIGSIEVARLEAITKVLKSDAYLPHDKARSFNGFIFDETKEHGSFTELQQKYLEEKDSLTICVDPEWMPIEAVVNSKHIGIAADYWKLFEEKLDLKIKIFKTQTWNSSLYGMAQNKCDVLSLSAPSKKRSEEIQFTDSLLELSFVLVTEVDKKSVIDFSLLDGTSIGVVKGYALIDVIEEKYPNINVIEVRNIDEGLKKVTEGELFGFADSAVAIDYAHKNGLYDDFKVSAHFDEKLKLGLGVSQENQILHSILQKVIRSITYEQKQVILQKWFASEYEEKFDYTRFFQLFFLLGTIVFVLIYRYLSNKRLNTELQKRVAEELDTSKEKDKMLFHQSKLIAMGEMIENIAHQWRQPLSQVNSCVLLIDDILDEKGMYDETIENKLHEIESITKYMSNTIDDFKNFFDQNKTKETVIVEDIIKKSIEVLKGRIEIHDIKMKVDYATAYELYTHANELQQVILIIFNNAIDILVTNEISRPQVMVNIEKDKDNIVITICDNAGGIKEKEINKVFEPYYTTKYKAKGTGLGLYISKIIIEDSLLGELKVENTSSGACFHIRLNVKGGNVNAK